MVKKIFSCGLIAGLLMGAYPTLATNPPQTENPPRIKLKSIFKPFVVTTSYGFVDILCLTNMGTSAIEIQDEVGNVVYTDNVQATANNTWSISVEDWELGNYMLSFTAATGVVYLWEFELVEE